MDRKTFALYTLGIGALVGFLADMLFYGKLVGISFPLFIGIGILIILVSRILYRESLPLHNLWIIVPALFFAVMVAIRDDHGLTTLNVAAALALCLLGLHYLPLSKRLDLDALRDYLYAIVEAGFGSVFEPIGEVGDAASWGFSRLRGNWRVVAAVGRGMLITAPVLLVFAVLLANADTVFAGYMDSIASLFSLPRLDASFYRLMMIGVVGWVACGAIAYSAARRFRVQREGEASEKPKRKRMSLGLIEACMALGSVDLLFGAFVLVQFAYFFGGREALDVGSLTYAEYARRGFFELVAVSVMTLGLVLALDAATVRRAARHDRLFRALAVVLVGLTGVLLVSASQRMLLYEEQYGFTTLRVYTHVFMLWLGVLFGFFLLALFRVRLRIFSLGVLIVCIGYIGTLNLMNVENYIAERNIARAEQGYALDMWYLAGFSTDATPAVLKLYQTTETPHLRYWSGQWLARQLFNLDNLRANAGGTVFSANLSRDAVWQALDTIRKTLPEFDRGYIGYVIEMRREEGIVPANSGYYGR